MAEEVKKSAGRPKKVEEPIVENNDTNKLKEENSAMAEMLKQMQEQMVQLQAQVEASKSNIPNIVLEQNKDITRTVKVTSLLNHTLLLCTAFAGTKNGKKYRFDKFGETKPILFSDMQQILNYHMKQIENGYAILGSKKDYDDLGIGYIYDNVMNKEKLESIVMLKDSESIDIILDMEEDMRENILNIIAGKIASGTAYDYNMIKELKENGYDVDKYVELIKEEVNEEK